jgi:REP element-mobilizing transposase RayT
MSRSYVLNYVHCVFSTKQRAQLIRDPESLWAYIRGIARNCKFDLLAVGGTVDHVHVLLALPGNRNLSDVMRDIKANSSRHMRESGVRFAWQDGYSGISVSPSQINAVRRYIANQEEHHRTRSFDEELMMLLERAGVRFDRAEIFG